MPKKGKKQKDVDWADDAHFDEKRVIVYVEHSEECPIFRVKAMELGAYLQKEYPNKIIQVVRNKNGKQVPRPGAFEISLSQHARSSIHDLWSGIDKGPPRREKIPYDYEILMPEIIKIMKKIYVKVVAKVEDDIKKEEPEEEEF